MLSFDGGWDMDCFSSVVQNGLGALVVEQLVLRFQFGKAKERYCFD